MKSKNQKPKTKKIRGFTLVETLVAITVLVIAVSGPLTLSAQSLFAGYYAKDQTTAFYLAQEAIEMVRNRRDNNALLALSGATADWLTGDPNMSTDDMVLDEALFVDVPNNTIVACGSSCTDKLLYDGTFYNHQSGEVSRFNRTVLLEQDTGSTDEVIVTATVSWKTGSFKERSFSLSTRLYNWIPQ